MNILSKFRTKFAMYHGYMATSESWLAEPACTVFRPVSSSTSRVLYLVLEERQYN
jgi:hypothetical protein